MIKISMNKNILVYIAGFRGDKSIRPALDGVYFSADGAIVASNGHRLGKVVDAWGVATADSEMMPADGVVLGMDKTDIAALRKAKDDIIMIDIDMPGRKATIMTDTLSFIVPLIDSPYPDLERVIPTSIQGGGRGPQTVCLSPTELVGFAGYSKKEFLRLSFTTDNPTAPVVVYNTALPSFVGVIAPCRL